ncbi:MAG: LytTR family transcriptional regulator DNA-binding domain-containing protein [Hyphomonadaceae bacterium]|nr:LytTR family transcriptional regulator DNA-binding domain-containing protein [Hyphomonadaceae bacterium]
MQPELRESTGAERERQASAVREAPFAGDSPRTWREWVRNLAIATGVGVVLAFVGAMESGSVPLVKRLLYWVPLMLGGGFLGHAMSLIVAKIPKAIVNPWLFGAILSIALTLPATLAVWGYTNLMFGARISLAALPGLFGSVFFLSAAMTALMIVVNWPGRVTHAPAPGAPVPAVRFAERLPAKLKGAVIYAVSAEDHYLRLHTSKGSDLILMRLSDAISELEGVEGAQTHRSWWVARDAVESTRRDGDKIVLVLKGGAEAPVSRPNVRALREARWF